MDLYMTSAESGLTLQEMIDCDIKSGVEFESGFAHDPLLGGFDFPGIGSGLDSEFEFKAFEPLFDPLIHSEDDITDTGSADDDSRMVIGDHSSSASWMNLSSMANFNLDVETSLMVNPSMVLPSPHHPQNGNEKIAPSSPNTSSGSSIVKVETFTESQNSSKECLNYAPLQPAPVTTQVVLKASTPNSSSNSPAVSSSEIQLNGFVPTSSNRPSNLTALSSVSSVSNSQQRHIITTTSTNGAPHSPGSAVGIGVTLHSTSSRTPSTLSYTPSRSKTVPKYRRERTPEEKSYPKPAYSYACLIALALKNSLTGSLPVSEIYNFMCEHFPYFRTAPNGWKNSVRHNLSLNKCFEKIEKPVVSGSNQRKGCLWALNPLKMHKMDEEVQKWSKKDLQGIKDAMTRPEVLENLERGEMKFEATSGASSCSEDSEDEDLTFDAFTFADAQNQTTAALHPPIKVISSSTTLTIPHSLNNSRLVQPNATTKIRIGSPHHQHIQETHNFSALKTSNLSRHQQFIQHSDHSPEPEYILPDSTLPEINIQSNGNLVDDLGNEITVEGDLAGILNPRSNGLTNGVSGASVAGTNLILKKVNASSPLRQGFVYATTAPSGALNPHQNGVSRLVLTNAKLS